MSLEGFKSHRASGLVQHNISDTKASETAETLADINIIRESWGKENEQSNSDNRHAAIFLQN